MNKQHQLTAEGLKRIEDELNELKNVKRPQVIEALQDARAQGDLSENAEYDAARDEQAKVENRIKELELILKNAQIISNNDNDGVVSVGKTVSIEYLDGVKKGTDIKFSVVGTLEADPMNKSLMKISTESPIGAAIVGRKLGETIQINVNGSEFHVLIKTIE